MQARKFLTAVFVLISPSLLQAAEYPISGVWASSEDPSHGVDACASYFKNPKAPIGNVLVFKGPKKTEFNGGYLEKETVDNLSVTKVHENEFKVVEKYYDDGEEGRRPGFKRRSYRLQLLAPNKIAIKTENYPSSQFSQCLEPSAVGPRLPATSGSQFQSAGAVSDLPKKVGQCVETSISEITDRFGQKLSPSRPKDSFDPGIAIKYVNGGFQISYIGETAIDRSTIGDKVKMCLVEIPKNCPPGDDRGRLYNTKNLRTGEAWTLLDALHMCGGA